MSRTPVRREAPRQTGSDLGGALGIVHRLLDQSERASLSAFGDASAGQS